MKASFFLPLFAATYVAAHGYVQKVTIDGTEYTGPAVASGSTDGITREVSTQDPIKGATNSDLTCGPGALAGSQVASVNPGSTVSFLWTGASGSAWPHNVGPMMTYMTNCGDSSCADFDPTGAEWFKIEEAGKTDGTWAQAALMNGATADVTIPSNLAAGNYLIRHEIIALHNAQSEGGAEFYASCTQLKVGGSGTGTPSSSDLVKLPGAYSDTDPGILIDVYTDSTNDSYTFPGPSVVNLGGGSSSASSSASASASHSASATSTRTHSSSSAVPTSNGASSGSTGGCKLKKKRAATNGTAILTKRETLTRRETVAKRPRHVSRIMRGLDFSSHMH
ncbi:glycosyl hydrolase family 61-domain-containing protein [Desarmillaria tabescens]|uniref:lytic cellulose monooxygenase (C4-dehydrogenating) n=1 Tax=Armillaria tabescens TaxID=1929756 RepID=A0AA39KCH4_ARMTA|nr:glycosyl hydrolase family 61-domain-containing protein [Desarmillaria tabescens]KAK0458273.1 glycosyl hydrolase family 61-domain-containing protein [Desarmillaria tabescens]